jgi:hypothetical protein
MEQSEAERSSSDAERNVTLTRKLFRSAFIASLLTLAQPNTGCNLASDAIEASSVKAQYEILLGVKDFLAQKGDKIKSYASLGDEDMARHTSEINSILTELIKQMEIAKRAADSVSKTNVRFNPIMLEGLEISLSLAIRQASPSDPKMQRLFNEADKMKRSKNGLGIRNIFVRWEGIDPDAVIRMAGLINKLRELLIELNELIARLNKDGIEGCTNNRFIEAKIKEKFGEAYCYVSIFCKAMAGAGYEDYDYQNVKFTPQQAVAVQRGLISAGLLPAGSDDGKFGSGSKKALSMAKKSDVFLDQVRKCRHK